MKARSFQLAGVSLRTLAMLPAVTAACAVVLPQVAVADTVVAQSPVGTGAVRGRVFDTVSGEYIRNAEVRVAGTNIVAYTEDSGLFRLGGVPEGSTTLIVRYAGLQDARADVTVVAGQTATADIQLTALPFAGAEGVASVDEVVVTAARGGQAKALMEKLGRQR